MVENIEKSLFDLDFASLTRRTFTPSPAAWEDQVLYFLLLDRFSDGKEKGGYRDAADRPVHGGSTPLYAPKRVSSPPPSLIVERKNGPLAVRMTLPPAGFAIYQAAPGLNRLGPSPPPDLRPWQPHAGRNGPQEETL